MSILIIVYILIFLVGAFSERFQNKAFTTVTSIFCIMLMLYFTLGITYTADYNMYAYFFKKGSGLDYFFDFLSIQFQNLHLNFHDLYDFHIVSMIFLYYLISRKFKSNFFYIFLLYISLDYVHFVNQIRFYLGFPILLLAFYELSRRKWFYFLVLTVLALLCHIALSTLLIFVPIYYLISEKGYIKKMLLLSAICFALVYLLFIKGLGSQIEHYGEYFNKSGISSFYGGVFYAIPMIVLVTFFYFQSIQYKKRNKNYSDDKEFIFLYKLSFLPVIFIPTSFFLQIAGQRYVLPFLFIWLIFFLKMLKNQKSHFKINQMFLMFIIFVFCGSFYYILPDYILKENHFLFELTKTLESINYKSF